ncbi:SMP-30/gluconolactonase/LRE family protein [Rhodopirellula sallentina]|uniref:Gluconolactonase n=1 Tax=Rhodopirellula sallentina SM41 TaxID=1263870 RepID=M5TSL0_9BACT|nr:SMP-30/gluconolactonase/LRE family protein [Rhodopirellula sallentina]EMI52145.1 gluconolactonase [Rhodopirellula sallentina SM41]
MNNPNEPIVRTASVIPFEADAARRYLPEGPSALTVPGWMSWVAIQHGVSVERGSINLLDLNTNTNHSFELPGRPGFAFAIADDQSTSIPTRFVAGIERSLGIFDATTQTWETFCDGVDEDVENTIINDGIVHGDDILFGTKDLEFADQKAGLYLYRGHDRRLIRLRDDQICSNGKMIRKTSEGRLKLIDIDSPTKKIVQYDLDIDEGCVGSAETLVDLTDELGVPDGAVLTPDATGIIVSIFLTDVAPHGETRWYDLATSQLRGVWQTPGSPRNTCPALIPFEDTWRIVITTATEGMSSEDQQRCPNAGRLFIADTDFR